MTITPKTTVSIGLLVGVCAFASGFAVTRNSTVEHEKRIERLEEKANNQAVLNQKFLDDLGHIRDAVDRIDRNTKER